MLVFSSLLTLGSLGLFIYTYVDNSRPFGVVIADPGSLRKVPLDGVRGWLSLPEGTALRVVGSARGYLLAKTARRSANCIRMPSGCSALF